MNVKQIATASVLAMSVMTVSATTTALGPVTAGVPLSFGGIAAPGPFLDVFTFTLPTTPSSGYSVANFTPVAGYNTIFSSMGLFKNPDGIVGNADDTLLTSVATGGSSLELSFGASAFGSYYISVSGITNGALGGLYTGAISASVVPEPQSYVLLLAGLSAVGFVAMRRRNGG